MKQLEQRLYEALRNRTGIRLSADEADELLLFDDAIRTRISNTASIEASADNEPGVDCIPQSYNLPTWNAFVDSFRTTTGVSS